MANLKRAILISVLGCWSWPAHAEVKHLISAELAVPVPAEFGLQFQGKLQGKVKSVRLDSPCNNLGGGECGAANRLQQVITYDDQQRLSTVRQTATFTSQGPSFQKTEMVLFTYDEQARYPKELFRQYEDGAIVMSTYERDRFGNIRTIRQGDVLYRYALNSSADGSDTAELVREGPAAAQAGVRRVFKGGREIRRIRTGNASTEIAGIDAALNTFARGQTEADIVWGFHPGGNLAKQATAQEILYFSDDPRLLPQARRLRAGAGSDGPYVASFWRNYQTDARGNWVMRERCDNSAADAAPVCVNEIREIAYF